MKKIMVLIVFFFLAVGLFAGELFKYSLSEDDVWDVENVFNLMFDCTLDKRYTYAIFLAELKIAQARAILDKSVVIEELPADKYNGIYGFVQWNVKARCYDYKFYYENGMNPEFIQYLGNKLRILK